MAEAEGVEAPAAAPVRDSMVAVARPLAVGQNRPKPLFGMGRPSFNSSLF